MELAIAAYGYVCETCVVRVSPRRAGVERIESAANLPGLTEGRTAQELKTSSHIEGLMTAGDAQYPVKRA